MKERRGRGCEAETGREGHLSQQVGKGTWMSQAELPAESPVPPSPTSLVWVLMAEPGSQKQMTDPKLCAFEVRKGFCFRKY